MYWIEASVLLEYLKSNCLLRSLLSFLFFPLFTRQERRIIIFREKHIICTPRVSYEIAIFKRISRIILLFDLSKISIIVKQTSQYICHSSRNCILIWLRRYFRINFAIKLIRFLNAWKISIVGMKIRPVTKRFSSTAKKEKEIVCIVRIFLRKPRIRATLTNERDSTRIFHCFL